MNHLNIICKLFNKMVSFQFIKWIRMLKKSPECVKRAPKSISKQIFEVSKFVLFHGFWRRCWFYIAVKFQNTIEYIYSRQRRFFSNSKLCKVNKIMIIWLVGMKISQQTWKIVLKKDLLHTAVVLFVHIFRIFMTKKSPFWNKRRCDQKILLGSNKAYMS